MTTHSSALPAALTPNLPALHPELSPGCSPVPWPLGAATSLTAHPLAPPGHWAPSVPPTLLPWQPRGQPEATAGLTVLQQVLMLLKGVLAFHRAHNSQRMFLAALATLNTSSPMHFPRGTATSPSKTQGATPDLAQEHRALDAHGELPAGAWEERKTSLCAL